MKSLPIPTRHSSRGSLDEKARIIQLERMIDILSRNYQALIKPQIGSRNIDNDLLGEIETGAKAITIPRDEPEALAGNQDNWDLASDRSLFVVSAGAAYNVTGIANGTDGHLIILTNDGANAITFVHQSTNSAEPNRFSFGSGTSYVLDGGAAVFLFYEAKASRWKGFRL